VQIDFEIFLTFCTDCDILRNYFCQHSLDILDTLAHVILVAQLPNTSSSSLIAPEFTVFAVTSIGQLAVFKMTNGMIASNKRQFVHPRFLLGYIPGSQQPVRLHSRFRLARILIVTNIGRTAVSTVAANCAVLLTVRMLQERTCI
jgi:hypothetical protein